MTQPEALRLADLLESCPLAVGDAQQAVAAAELRRLHAENERLKTMPMKYRRMEFNAQLQAENDGLRAQRGVLLEALRKIGQYTGEGPTYSTPWQDIVADLGQTARAAIKAVEERRNEL